METADLNGFFQASCATVASAVMPPNSAVSGNPYAAVPSLTASAVPGLLASFTEVQPASVQPAPDGGVAPDMRNAAPAATTAPVAGGGFDPSSTPAFAFLQDAPSIHVEPSSESASPSTPSQAFGSVVPDDAALRLFPFH